MAYLSRNPWRLLLYDVITSVGTSPFPFMGHQFKAAYPFLRANIFSGSLKVQQYLYWYSRVEGYCVNVKYFDQEHNTVTYSHVLEPIPLDLELQAIWLNLFSTRAPKL